MDKKNSAITESKRPWLFSWTEPESVLTVIPRSKTKRLAKQAQLANVDAERAINRAYQQEVIRIKTIGEAMYKSGKALRFTVMSSGREVFLRTKVLSKKINAWFSG